LSGVRWKTRGTYGRILHRTIKKLERRFQNEKAIENSIALAKTIGYLASVQREMIKDESMSILEQRIEVLEKKVENK
jgi:hypothetical protein